MEYKEREELKRKGWDDFSKAETPSGKCQVLMHTIIKSHYWRAREALENRKDCKACLKKIRGSKYYPGYELDIDHYTEHWLFANQDHECMMNGVKEAAEEDWYTPKESKYMTKGCSSYSFL